jgi:hypothetical protein
MATKIPIAAIAKHNTRPTVLGKGISLLLEYIYSPMMPL